MKKTSFIATGDAFITRRFPEGGYEGFEAVRDCIMQHDVKFSNLEMTFHDHEGYPAAFSGGTWAMAHPSLLKDVKKYGFNVYNSANNHSMDYSHNGLLATTKYLKQEDMNFAGIGENLSDASAPVYVEGENIRAAVIAATSSFHESWAAGNQRLDMKGRPTKLCSAFIVERTDPGFSVGKAEDKMGIRGSSTCELIFEDCRIPKDRMLGVRGKGFQLAMATLDGGRIGIASQALGIAEGALEETVAYVKERKQFGRAIAAFQNTQFELAEMKARVEAAKYLVYAAALKKQEAMDGKKIRYSVEAAQAKLIAARTASDVTRRCLQLFGGYGYTRDYPIERMMRDAKITEIYEGTSEVQMMVISGALLK